MRHHEPSFCDSILEIGRPQEGGRRRGRQHLKLQSSIKAGTAAVSVGVLFSQCIIIPAGTIICVVCMCRICWKSLWSLFTRYFNGKMLLYIYISIIVLISWYYCTGNKYQVVHTYSSCTYSVPFFAHLYYCSCMCCIELYSVWRGPGSEERDSVLLCESRIEVLLVLDCTAAVLQQQQKKGVYSV